MEEVIVLKQLLSVVFCKRMRVACNKYFTFVWGGGFFMVTEMTPTIHCCGQRRGTRTPLQQMMRVLPTATQPFSMTAKWPALTLSMTFVSLKSSRALRNQTPLIPAKTSWDTASSEC